MSGESAPRRAEGELGRDIIYIKEAPGEWLKKDRPFYRSDVFYALWIIPLLFITALYVFQRRRTRFRSDTAYSGRILSVRSSRKGIARLKKQLNDTECREFYETLFKTLQDYLGYRLLLPPAGVTADAAAAALSSKGVAPEVVNRVKGLFDTCDRARFAYISIEDFKKRDDLKELEGIIRYLERKKL